MNALLIILCVVCVIFVINFFVKGNFILFTIMSALSLFIFPTLGFYVGSLGGGIIGGCTKSLLGFGDEITVGAILGIVGIVIGLYYSWKCIKDCWFEFMAS